MHYKKQHELICTKLCHLPTSSIQKRQTTFSILTQLKSRYVQSPPIGFAFLQVFALTPWPKLSGAHQHQRDHHPDYRQSFQPQIGRQCRTIEDAVDQHHK